MPDENKMNHARNGSIARQHLRQLLENAHAFAHNHRPYIDHHSADFIDLVIQLCGDDHLLARRVIRHFVICGTMTFVKHLRASLITKIKIIEAETGRRTTINSLLSLFENTIIDIDDARMLNANIRAADSSDITVRIKLAIHTHKMMTPEAFAFLKKRKYVPSFRQFYCAPEIPMTYDYRTVNTDRVRNAVANSPSILTVVGAIHKLKFRSFKDCLIEYDSYRRQCTDDIVQHITTTLNGARAIPGGLMYHQMMFNVA